MQYNTFREKNTVGKPNFDVVEVQPGIAVIADGVSSNPDSGLVARVAVALAVDIMEWNRGVFAPLTWTSVLPRAVATEQRFVRGATTIDILEAYEGVIYHAGDGRVYSLRAGEPIKQLTKDHNNPRQPHYIYNSVSIRSKFGALPDETPVELLDFEWDIIRVSTPPDGYLLCTDGWYKSLQEGTPSDFFLDSPGDALVSVHKRSRAMGSRDDSTAIIVTL